MLWRTALQILLILTAGGPALALMQAQELPQPATRENERTVIPLRRLLEPLGIQVADDLDSRQSRPAIDLLVRWDDSVPLPARLPSPSKAGYRTPHAVLQRKPQPRGIQVPRAFELPPDHLLVTVLDSNNRLLAWSVIADPRIIRSEQPGPDGILRGSVVRAVSPTILLSVPDDPAAAETRIWAPRVADGETTLALVAVLPAR